MQRFLTGLVIILLLAGGVGYLVLSNRQGRDLERITAETHATLASERAADAAVARELAEDLAGTLAVTLADDLARDELAAVDAQLAAVVQGRRLAGVLVIAQDGRVLGTTDLRYRGRTLDDEATRKALAALETMIPEAPPAPGQVEVDTPVFSGGQRLATLRVFVDLGKLAAAGGK